MPAGLTWIGAHSGVAEVVGSSDGVACVAPEFVAHTGAWASSSVVLVAAWLISHASRAWEWWKSCVVRAEC